MWSQKFQMQMRRISIAMGKGTEDGTADGSSPAGFRANYIKSHGYNYLLTIYLLIAHFGRNFRRPFVGWRREKSLNRVGYLGGISGVPGR